MTAAQQGASPTSDLWIRRLVGSGLFLVAIGAMAGLASKAVAERAANVASTFHTRLISDPNNPIALEFDPSSAHHVIPDYTQFWMCMLVVAVGLLALLVGIGMRLRSR